MSRFLSEACQRLVPYTPGEQPAGRTYIKLNTNECPYPPSPMVVQAAAQQAETLNLYPNPQAAGLMEAMAAHFGTGTENVYVGNGSDEVLAFAFQGFCPRGAAFADVTYAFYSVYASLYGLEAQVVPLEEDFTLAPEKYYGIGKTIFIANPNAPTGLALGLSQIEGILQNNPDDLVVIDEAYVDFGAESAVALLDRYDNLLVVGTFSKSRALAGARLGYAVSSKEVIAGLNRIKFSFNPYNVNRMTLAAGTAALKDTACFEDCMGKVLRTRAAGVTRLRQLGFELAESKTNFLFATHPAMPAEQIYLQLREKGILVRWFNQPRIENHLRITVGTDDEMETLYGALKDILGQ